MSIPTSAHEIITKISELTKEVNGVLQDPFFDSLAMTKQHKIAQKLHLNDFSVINTVYLGDHLRNARPMNSKRKYINLPVDFLDTPPNELPSKGLFLLTNNDIGKNLPKYISFYENNPDILFIIWDWDSQHWIYMSSILAMNCDFYIPATSENSFLLSHFNPNTVGPIFAVAHQWTKLFLLENIDLLLQARLDEPLGIHGYYGDFPKRNRAINTVSNTFSTVGFGNNDFKSRSDLDNLKEWAQYKTHWIVPVLGGVPIRVYNALITGGIPILPSFYKNMPEVINFGGIPLYYETSDLIDPRPINKAAVDKFDSGSVSGLIQRIIDSIGTNHIDANCDKIILSIEDIADNITTSYKEHRSGYLGLRHNLQYRH